MKHTTALAVASALFSTSAFAFEFHGYMRAGLGANVDGGGQKCYGTGGPDWHTVGRLGDECDTYAELALSTNVMESEDVSFSIHTLVAYGTAEGLEDYRGNSWQGLGEQNDPWSGQRLSLREAYVKADFGSYGLWAGNRYYGRKDVAITDFYYINTSGYGAGIENIQVGPGLLSAAWLQRKWKSNQVLDEEGEILSEGNLTTTNVLDLRYSGIPLWKNASLEAIAMYGSPSYDAQQRNEIDAPPVGEGSGGSNNHDWGLDQDGVSLTLEQTQGNFFGGFNKLVAQYSTEGFAWAGYKGNHLGDSYNLEKAQDGRKALRLIDHGVLSPHDDIDLAYAFTYAQIDVGANDKPEFVSAVLRPSYKWSDNMKTILELGYSSEKSITDWGGDGDWHDLRKVTLSQAWTAGREFWARPEIRVFVTHYDGDVVSAREVEDVKANTMVGVQAEAWW